MSIVATQAIARKNWTSGSFLRLFDNFSSSVSKLCRMSCMARKPSVPIRVRLEYRITVSLSDTCSRVLASGAEREQIHLEGEPAAAGIIAENVLQRRIGNQAAIPIELAIGFHRGKRRGQRAAGHDMPGPNLHLRIVEVAKIARSHIDGAHAEAGFARIDAIKIDQAFQRRLERLRIVVAGGRVGVSHAEGLCGSKNPG